MTGRPRLVPDGGLVILSYCFPPMAVGPAFVIDAILSELDLGESVVFTGDPDRYSAPQDDFGRTRVATRAVDVPAWWPRTDTTVALGPVRLPLRVRAAGNVLVGFRLALAAARALRRPNMRGMLVVYPKQHFLLAGCIAALLVRKPLFVYFMDVYVEGLSRGRRTARLLERYVARRARLVFAMSETHREQLLERLRAYGVEDPFVVELPHPYAGADGAARTGDPLPGRPSLLFSGAIYDAQVDAIRRLATALDADALADLDPHLTLLTQSTEDELEAWGIRPGRRVSIRRATRAEVRAAQSQADILFLPIAFDAKRHVRETASPSKMPEYLAARRPVLVHSPSDSYLTRYAREYGFAEVVDVPDAAAVAEAVRRIVRDPVRREELARKAVKTLERHLASSVATLLRTSIDRALHGAGPAATEASRGTHGFAEQGEVARADEPRHARGGGSDDGAPEPDRKTTVRERHG